MRSTWDSENTTPLSPISAHRSSISPRSTEYSYEENVFQLSDFRIDSASSSPLQQLAFVTHFPKVPLNIHGTETKEQSHVQIEEIEDQPHVHVEEIADQPHVHIEEIEDQPHVHIEEIEGQPHVHVEENVDQPHVQEERFNEMAEQDDVNSEDNCREVRCIEMEKSDTSIGLEEYMPGSSPTKYEAVNAKEPVCVTEPKNLRSPAEAEDEEEERVKEVSSASPQLEQESKFSTPPPLCDIKCFPDEFDTSISNLRRNPMPPALTTPSPEKPFLWHTERDSQAFGGMKLTRSRSCRASLLSSSSSSWLEKDADTPPSWYDKEFLKTAERNLAMCEDKDERLLQDELSGRSLPTTWLDRSLSDQTTHAPSHGVSNEMSSPNESLSRPSDAAVFELQTSGRASIIQDRTEETAAQKDKRIIHRSVSFPLLGSTRIYKLFFL